MTTYAVHCLNNPCSCMKGYWTIADHDEGWSVFKPSSGTSINSAYKCLESLNNTHLYGKACKCEFELVELG